MRRTVISIAILSISFPASAESNSPGAEGISEASQEVIAGGRGGGALDPGEMALRVSLGLSSGLRVQIDRGLTGYFDAGAFGDLNPIFLGATVGVAARVGADYGVGEIGLRVSLGYALHTVGDNVATHGIDASFPDASSQMGEIELSNSFYISPRAAFIFQAGALGTTVSDASGRLNSVTLYGGAGVEIARSAGNFYFIARALRIHRIDDEQFQIPGAEAGWILRY